MDFTIKERFFNASGSAPSFKERILYQQIIKQRFHAADDFRNQRDDSCQDGRRSSPL
ncbi:unnamed protein product [Lupinus luteus]|uniref:Uncharacterized protein n=1 Tax=Lupinus luteus TaxID=3873 RepID=A0AAV1YFP5_LUPLU